MKKFSKFMMAALAIGATTSCSDDLSSNLAPEFAKADMVGTLNSPMGEETRAGILEGADGTTGNSFVWTSNDVVRVFTMSSLKFNNYQIASGAGSGTAAFNKTDDTPLPSDETKYAVTESDNVYSVSAIKGKPGMALLTMTLDGTCKISKESNGAYQFPIPFWGVCNEDEVAGKTQLTCGFNALTAYLRIDINSLPKGTKSIVLTTHGDPYLVQDETQPGLVAKDIAHGYQLLEPVAATGKAPTGYEDTNNYWDKTDATSGEHIIPYISGGTCQALSGTLNAELEPGANAALTVDKRLVSYDTLRVDVPEGNDKVMYIPVVANKYDRLDVIAVTGDSRYAYRWIGNLLKSYTNKDFKNGLRYKLTMNMVTFDKVDLATLNKAIFDNNQKKGKFTPTTIVSVNELVNNDGVTNVTGYATDKIQVTGNANLVLNIKKIAEYDADESAADKFAYGASTDKVLLITDNQGAAKEADFSATINLPEEWQADLTNKTSYVKVILPTYKTILGTVGGANSQITFDVLGCTNQFVSGLERVASTSNAVLKNETNAAITVKNGIKTLNVLEETKGDVYVYTANEETEISEALNIKTLSPVDIRIDDALAKKINIKKGGRHMIYTTGSAATQGIADFDDNTKLPFDTFTQSFYTGAGLSDYAWANGYCTEIIYTVAQLQSMGEKTRSSFTGTTPPTIPSNYAMWDKIELFWLGATTYPWIGPEVTVDNFTFDGKNKRLMNMNFFVQGDKANDKTIYVDDPHFCCTSCGKPAVAGTIAGGQKKIEKDLGLIRSIVETGKAVVKNVNLNDVLLNTVDDEKLKDIVIPNIGSLVGRVELTAPQNGETGFHLIDNFVGEVKINVNGNNVAGLVGYVKADSVNATGNEIKSTKNDGGYVKTKKSFAGGMFGYVETINKGIDINDNLISMKKEIEAGESFAGGIAGFVKNPSAQEGNINDNTVAVKSITAKAGSNAAGLVGILDANELTRAFRDKVTTEDIIAGTQYAAGLVAQSSKSVYLAEFDVDVTTSIQAAQGYVGGVLGQIAEGKASVGTTNADLNNADKNAVVKVALLKGSHSVGGLIGNNKGEAMAYIYAQTNRNGTNKSTINVEVASYANTYTKDNAPYESTSDNIFYGTFQDVVGFMQNDVNIYKDNLTVSGALDDTLKKAVLYDLHNDFGHDTTTGEYYWGDTYGYVGYAQNGNYKLFEKKENGSGYVEKTLRGEQEDGYNYYKAY